MSFQDAMYEVLETSRYDFLTGRRVDIRETVGDLIERFLVWLFQNFTFNIPEGTGGAVGMIATIFAVVAVVLVAIAVIVLIRAYKRSRVAKRHTLSDIFEEIKSHTVAELLELAEKAESRRVAVRYKYIAVILSLNENDIITIEPSHTNAVILRQIKAAAPELFPDFSEIAEIFHLAWFGHKNLTDAAFNKLNAAVGGVINRG